MSGAAGQIPLFLPGWEASGFLVGAILPLGLHMADRQAPAREAGQLNAADYLGGAIGAMATASFLLPLYGSANSLLLIAVPASGRGPAAADPNPGSALPQRREPVVEHLDGLLHDRVPAQVADPFLAFRFASRRRSSALCMQGRAWIWGNSSCWRLNVSTS